MLKRNFFQALVATALFAAASSALPAEPTTVKVHLSDSGKDGMSLTLAPSTIPAGPVEFAVTNESRTMKHEFLILPWSSDAKALPYDPKTQQVKEDSLSKLQGVEDLKPRETVTTRLVLAPGRYVAFCNEPGHFRDAMRATFIVSEAK